jgi:hypothetical protein
MTMVDINANRRRPAAAIAARRRGKTQRLAAELAARLDELDDRWLETLAQVIAAELEARTTE